ncbi:MAG: phosphotransferase [Actinomycetota bacterium]|nr:phosphotransferase [Actinomycetota bacterium]
MTETSDLRERIDAVFPQLEARSARAIGTGWTVDTYEIDDEWIVQLPRSDHAAERLRAQIETLPELAAELSALVPEPVYTDATVPAIAYRKLEGLPLDRAPDGLWPERLGRFLYDLHLMPPEYVGLRGIRAKEVRDADATALETFRTRILPLLEPAEAERFGTRFSAFLDDEDLWRFAPCLLHGDIGPEHVLVSADGDLVGVLDWEELSVGDPVGDFAWLLHARPSDGARALGAYGGAPDPTFHERAAFRYFLMPFHEVIYGLEIDDPAYVASGIEGIRARADVVTDRR